MLPTPPRIAAISFSGRPGPEKMKSFNLLLAVLLVTAGWVAVAPFAPAYAAGQSVAVTWTSEDGAYKLATRPATTLQPSSTAATDVTVNVDPGARYQTVFGQGGVLESSSVWNIAHLSAARRDQLMAQLFNPATGNGYSVVRLAMGCPDMCSQAFHTYDDGPADPGLTRFSIQKDLDAGIVALARQARAINPQVRFFLSMWSAPAWMKTNGSLIGGGSIRPEYYPVLARYQRLAIQAYQAQGIPITAMTPQNEPLVVPQYPSGQWTGAQMRDYVKNNLGPELRGAGLATQIWVGDDNPPSLRTFVPAILDDPAAARYVGGVAVHDYSGDDPSVLSDFRLRYPAVPLHLTERSYYGVNGERTTAGAVQAGVRRVMDFFRNGIASWTYWITFLDTAGQPNTGPLDAACCAVPFSAPPGNLDAYTTNRDFYLYGQFSRYVKPGAARVGSDQTSADVGNVAFRNPDGSMVVVVANGAAAPRSVRIASPDGVLTDTLPALSVGTYRWAGGPVPADPRLGTFRLVNRANPAAALQDTGDHYFGSADSFSVVASPTAWNGLDQRWAITSAGGGWYRLTSAANQSTALHTTGERYQSYADVWNVAATPASLNWDEQLWQLADAGGGWYRLVNKARGTVLQATADRYGGFTDVFQVVSSPAAWNIAEQQWRLSP
jgi:glucosylceramidase